MGFWQTIFTAFGAFAAVVAVVAFLAKAIVKQLLQRDLDRHKADLQSQSDQAIERLKAELRVAAEQRSTQYQIMQTKVAEVLAETYARLDRFVRASARYTAELEYSNEPSKEEKLETLAKAYDDLHTYFYPHRVFFPEQVGAGVDDLIAKCRDIANRLTSLLADPEHRRPRQEGDDSWHKLNEEMQKEAQPLLHEIRRHFQEILGVTQTVLRAT